MELVGIALSVPVAFLANLVYCFFLSWVVLPRRTLRRFLWTASAFVLGAFATEIGLLTTLGAVRARALLGPGFYVGYLVLFFLGPPALGNVLVLYAGQRRPLRWYL